MKKKIYLLILFLLSCSFLSNSFTSIFLTKDTQLVLSFFWIAIGWVYYGKYSNNILNKYNNQKYFFFIAIIISVSAFIPLLYFDQSILFAVVAQRPQYLFVFIGLLFLRIFPTNDDFIYVFRVTAYLSLGCFIISIFVPMFFLDVKELQEQVEIRSMTGSTDIGFVAPGLQLTAFYLFYCIQRLFKRPSQADFLEACLFMSYIILCQNRSTIIGTFPFFCLGLLFMKTPKRKLYFSVLALALIVSIPTLIKLYNSMLEETRADLIDPNYNRWQALSFYLVELKNEVITIFLGNGLWGHDGSYHDMMYSAQVNRGTYVSDLGILGAYYYYGIGVIAILCYFIFKAITKKKIPLYLKFFSFFMLFVPTIHNFLLVNLEASILYSSYFYLVIFNSLYGRSRRIRNNSKLQYA